MDGQNWWLQLHNDFLTGSLLCGSTCYFVFRVINIICMRSSRFWPISSLVPSKRIFPSCEKYLPLRNGFFFNFWKQQVLKSISDKFCPISKFFFLKKTNDHHFAQKRMCNCAPCAPSFASPVVRPRGLAVHSGESPRNLDTTWLGLEQGYVFLKPENPTFYPFFIECWFHL